MMNMNDTDSDGAEPPLIAVVDDNILVLKMLRYFLPSAGYRVVTWARATGAVEMIEHEKPVLVILDIRMEHDRAGMEVLRALRERPGTEHIPVLFVSAWADSLTTDERGELRATRADTMMKPFEFGDLLSRMWALLAP